MEETKRKLDSTEPSLSTSPIEFINSSLSSSSPIKPIPNKTVSPEISQEISQSQKKLREEEGKKESIVANTQTGKIKEMIKLWISININEVIDNLDKELENKRCAFYTISDICTLDRQEAWDGEEILEQYVPNHIEVLTGMYPYYYYFLAKRQNS